MEFFDCLRVIRRISNCEVTLSNIWLANISLSFGVSLSFDVSSSVGISSSSMLLTLVSESEELSLIVRSSLRLPWLVVMLGIVSSGFCFSL